MWLSSGYSIQIHSQPIKKSSVFLQRISMHIQNSLFTLAFLIMGVAHCFSQEICDNGIDDDSDGLVDLNDPDCSCGQEIWTLLDNIPNPSFEEKLCTPNSLSQLFCVTDWEQPAPGTTDYFHTDGLNYNCLFPSGSPSPTSRLTARRHIRSNARSQMPIQRMQWWMRPGPSRSCAMVKPAPSSPSR